MLSSVLNSERAIEVNIAIIRKLSEHEKYFRVVFDELKKLTAQPTSSRRQIGFKTNEKE